MHRTFLGRTIILSLVLPFLYFGTASATFLYRIHSENSSRSALHLPIASPPLSTQRILIVSPHPDDETLGCAGLIQQARAAGADVRVVMLTNGDGFRVAVERQFRTLDVEPKDYVAFAAIRQQEACRALASLGVPKDHVTFMGYPDRGLLALWNENWSPDRPFTSAYTRQNRSPYDLAFHHAVRYCGQCLLDDVKAVLRGLAPTDVYVTHPSDDHGDHTAASSFVALALQELRAEKAAFAGHCELHYFLVHRGDWPAPQGLYKSDPLVPPTEMAALDTHWRIRPLTDDQVERKAATILSYHSQTSVMKRFLVSFARKNELFGSLDAAAVPHVRSGRVIPDGEVADWAGLEPVVLDPVNDDLLRDFQSGADIRSIYACRDAANLYLRIDTYQSVSDRVDFRIGIRYFGDVERGEAGGSTVITIRPNGQTTPGAIRAALKGSRLEAAIPLRDLGYAHNLALNVTTAFAGIQVDRTGYRFLKL